LASSFAFDSIETLNPITIPFEADARRTSDSEIAPIPLCIIDISTSSCGIFSIDFLIASTEPDVSHFNIIFNSFAVPVSLKMKN